jgi:porin
MVAAGVVCPVCGEEALSFRGRDRLFGLWGGLVEGAESRGLTFDLTYTVEMYWNVHGGLETGSAYRADASLTLEWDTSTAGWWDGGTIFAHVQGQHGDGITERLVGDFQVLSNIDADDFFQLSEIWYRHTWLDERVCVKIGKQDANADFAFVEHGVEFSNSSPGFSPTIPLVTYPDPDWGIVVGVSPVAWFSMNAGVYQGRADGGHSVSAALRSLHGPMAMIEPAIHYEVAGLEGHLRVGAWWNGDDFAELAPEEADTLPDVAGWRTLVAEVRASGWGTTYLRGLAAEAGAFLVREATARLLEVDGEKDETWGWYATWDQRVWEESEGQGVGVFAQFGYSDEDVIEVERYFGAGIEWAGALPGRDDDVLGLGVFHVNFSERLELDEDHETVVEAFYKAQVTPWLSVKPDVQWIVNPGGRDDEAWALGGRVEVRF